MDTSVSDDNWGARHPRISCGIDSHWFYYTILLCNGVNIANKLSYITEARATLTAFMMWKAWVHQSVNITICKKGIPKKVNKLVY